MIRNEYEDDYGTCAETFATLLAHHLEEHPSNVTDALGTMPTTITVPGTGRRLADGTWRTFRVPRKWNVWSLCSEKDVDSYDALRHIDWLLTTLDGKDATLGDLREREWEFRVSVFWSSRSGHGGPTLTPTTMGRLAELGLPLLFDVYDADIPEADDE